jgi:hypothetical protein
VVQCFGFRPVCARFVDFRKAFDRVDHTLMLKKLLRYGVTHSLVK